MFDSRITASKLIEELKEEVDIAIQIPNSSYISWLNSLQQLLYSEVIKEQKETEGVSLDFKGTKYFEFANMEQEMGESPIRYEDVHAVYTSNGTQLIESTTASSVIFPNTYWKVGSKSIGVNISAESGGIRIIYFVRPEIIEEATVAMKNVMIPIEFIDLVKAKLRGEAYKLANEDVLAAKWLNDYNALLETFKAWITAKMPTFGL
jgi:hypothetical protein